LIAIENLPPLHHVHLLPKVASRAARQHQFTRALELLLRRDLRSMLKMMLELVLVVLPAVKMRTLFNHGGKPTNSLDRF
jgi:hypothetical protein